MGGITRSGDNSGPGVWHYILVCNKKLGIGDSSKLFFILPGDCAIVVVYPW